MEKETIERYLKHFDTIFGTKTVRKFKLNNLLII